MKPLSWPSLALLSMLVVSSSAGGAEPGPQGASPSNDPDDRIARMISEIERASEALDGVGDRLPATPGALETTFGAFPPTPEAAARREALTRYAETGEPPVLGLPTRRVYPYGHQIPIVRCLPLRACDLVFQAGEQLAGWALGDTERWIVAELAEGGGDAAVPHLLLKPTDFELATNLVVVTDRRTYHLELESPTPEEVRGDDGDASRATDYDAQLSWWYPDEFVREARQRQASAERAATTAVRRHQDAVALDVPLDPARLSFAYEVKRPWRPSRRLGWQPVTVFDDGRRIYLRLPPAARVTELPVVLGLLEDDETYPLDARFEGDWLIVPSLTDRLELVVGSGKTRRSLTIVRKGG